MDNATSFFAELPGLLSSSRSCRVFWLLSFVFFADGSDGSDGSDRSDDLISPIDCLFFSFCYCFSGISVL